MNELISREKRLAHTVARQEEYRDVKVFVSLFENDLVREVREDTGEIITTRQARPEERQLPLDS